MVWIFNSQVKGIRYIPTSSLLGTVCLYLGEISALPFGRHTNRTPHVRSANRTRM
jgi:hypothetical protein